MTESALREPWREELADQTLIRTVLARLDERAQAIEVDIDTMSVIGLGEAREAKPR